MPARFWLSYSSEFLKAEGQELEKLSRTPEVFPLPRVDLALNPCAQLSSHVLLPMYLCNLLQLVLLVSSGYQSGFVNLCLIYVQPTGTLFDQQRINQNYSVPLLPLPVENDDYLVLERLSMGLRIRRQYS